MRDYGMCQGKDLHAHRGIWQLHVKGSCWPCSGNKCGWCISIHKYTNLFLHVHVYANTYIYTFSFFPSLSVSLRLSLSFHVSISLSLFSLGKHTEHTGNLVHICEVYRFCQFWPPIQCFVEVLSAQKRGSDCLRRVKMVWKCMACHSHASILDHHVFRPTFDHAVLHTSFLERCSHKPRIHHVHTPLAYPYCTSLLLRKIPQWHALFPCINSCESVVISDKHTHTHGRRWKKRRLSC